MIGGVVRVMLFFVGLYVLLVIAMYIFQRSLQYFPMQADLGNPAAYDAPFMKVVKAKTDDGLELTAWFAPPKQKDGKIVVLFHGNGGNITFLPIKAVPFTERGYGVYLCEYRGYGDNPGNPDEEGLYKDARAGLHWLESQGYKAGQFVLYGESIGTGVAVQMALEIQPKYLILEAPFSSAEDIAKNNYSIIPVSLLMKDKFESIEKIGKVKSSLLIVHGDEDVTIPIRFSQKLFTVANHPKEYVTIAGGGHNNLYEHHAGHIIADWLDKQVKEEQKP